MKHGIKDIKETIHDAKIAMSKADIKAITGALNRVVRNPIAIFRVLAFGLVLFWISLTLFWGFKVLVGAL